MRFSAKLPCVLLVTGPAVLSACTESGTTPVATEPAVAADGPAAASGDQGSNGERPGRYGEPIPPGTTTELREVLKSPERYAGKEVLVEGAVRQACTRKGCWMELAESMDGASPGCRVTFRNYGFFVPTSSAGSRARVQAKVKLADVSKAHVDHMESEGATFAHKNPDGTAREVRLVATGVELTRL